MSNMLSSESKDEVAGATPKVHVLPKPIFFKALLRSIPAIISLAKYFLRYCDRVGSPYPYKLVDRYKLKLPSPSQAKQHILIPCKKNTRRISQFPRFLVTAVTIIVKTTNYLLRYKRSSRHRIKESGLYRPVDRGSCIVSSTPDIILSFFFSLFAFSSLYVKGMFFSPVNIFFFYPNSDPEIMKYLCRCENIMPYIQYRKF